MLSLRTPISTTTSRYRPEIDGLRAVSVVAVLLFHLKVSGFSGGYVGVDIFFVISGYLIVRYIISEIESDTFRFSQFYERRIRRLFPALFATVALSSCVAVVLLSPDDLRDFARNVITTFLAISNVVLWRDSNNYFAPNVEYLPLLHTWSLSLEEQFYLACPAILIVLARLRRAPSTFTAAFIVAGVTSLAACQFWLPRDASAVFYLAPFRVFEFSIGALCIDVERRLTTSPLVREAIAACGCVALVASIGFLTTETPFPGMWALLPCCGAAAIICTNRNTMVGSLLTNRLAVGVGLISYSLYLCHWPIVVFARYAFGEISTPPAKLTIIAMSLGLATVLYRFVETPFRRPPGSGMPKSFLRVALICATLTMCVAGPAWLAVAQNGWGWRLNAEQLALREQNRHGESICVVDGRTECAFGVLDAPIGLLMIGDSHMRHLVPAFDATMRVVGRRGESYAVPACIMLVGLQRTGAHGAIDTSCRLARDRFFALAIDSGKNTPLVISQMWTVDTLSDDAGLPLQASKIDLHMRLWHDALERTISLLGADGRRILIIGPSIALGCRVDRRILQIGPFSGPIAPDCPAVSRIEAHTKYAPITNMLRTVQRAHADQVTLLLPEDYLCDDICHAAIDGVQLYADETHLTLAGAAYIGARAGDVIRKFLTDKRSHEADLDHAN